MDEAVKNLFLTALAALATLALAPFPASAQGLIDPTRPPAGLGQVDSTLAAGDGAPRLQSVLISPKAGGRHVAVIDGETVRLGDTFKGARVARMTAGEVVLERGAERQVLRMEAPLAGMTPVAK